MRASKIFFAAVCCAVFGGQVQAQSAASTAPTNQSAESADSGAIEEIVITTGYTTEKKKDLIGAVSVVNIDDVKDRPTSSIMQAIQGQISGVQIQTDGNPGNSPTVKVRGQGIGGLGFNSPLYIVDGVPLNVSTGIQELDQSSIQSVEVLKDAASASIYGSRAANGVVLITTKRGSGALSLSVSASQTRQSFSWDITPMNTQQRAKAWYQRAINSNENPNNALYAFTCNNAAQCDSTGYSKVVIGGYADAAGNRYLDPGLTQRVSDTNWLNAVTENSKITEATVSLSSSSADSHFFSSFNFYDAHGIVRNSQFKRFNITVNTDHSMFDDKLKLGENFLFTNQLENEVNAQANFIIAQALETQSIIPIHTVDGIGWGGPASGTTDHRQPVEILTNNAGDVSRLNKFLGSLYAELRPIDGLLLRASVGTDYSQKYYRNYFPGGATGNVLLVDNLNTSFIWNRSITVSDTADYKRTLWTHNNFDFLIGYENIDFSTENFFGDGTGFASPADTYTFLSQATQNVTAGGGGDAWTLRSEFAKINYDYDNKYLAAVTIRRDGSSRFGANNRYGVFPSAALGWRLSQEPWFKLDFVNDLKARVSVGTNGNQEISTAAGTTIYSPRYSTTSLFADFPCCQQETGTAYDLNGVNTGTLPSGFAKTATGNPNLKWETSKQINFGVDFNLFNDRLEGSIDMYRKRTSDILTVTKPLATAGEGAQQVVNGGTVDNKGFELEIGHRSEFKTRFLSVPIKYRIAMNLSHSTNRVVALPADVVNSFPGNGADQTVLGRSINSLYGYVGAGLFQTQAEVAASGQPGAYVGGLRIADLNHDGKIDAKDRTFYGTTDPNYTFGINFDASYKDVSFNMFWQGVNGGLIDEYQKFYDQIFDNPGANRGTGLLNAWSPSNTGSTIPAAHDGYGTLPDSYFHGSGSYLKLRNLAVSYNLPESVITRVRMKSFRVYLQGENLVIIKPKGTYATDPETPSTQYPNPRRFSLGFEGRF